MNSNDSVAQNHSPKRVENGFELKTVIPITNHDTVDHIPSGHDNLALELD